MRDENVPSAWQAVFYGLLAIVATLSFSLSGKLPVGGLFFATSSLIVLALFAVRAGGQLAQIPQSERRAFARASWRPALGWAARRWALFQGSVMLLYWLAPIKAAIPLRAGYWADAYLAQIERMPFGRDPWEILHQLPNAITPLIDFIYGAWVIVIVLASLLVAVFGTPRLVARFFLSWAMIWVLLGMVVAHLLPSAGPIFGPDLGFGFEGLHHELQGTLAMHFHQMLWDMRIAHSSDLGGGISAMPSMHCALTSLLVAMAWRSRWRGVALAYAATIWFGSVYLGWHYALDGLVSFVGVALIWRLASVVAEIRLPAFPRSSERPGWA